MTLLDSLNFPDDLKKLSIEQLEQLAQEIRERLLDIGNTCGGHLASNLGVVELTLILHSLFESPKDRFFWDTSHQVYVHKMLTGRLDKMYTIRQDNGLSGFAKIGESEHDVWGAGHASTALSAALGMAHARDHLNQDYSVVAIVGDSSFSGGMTFEALNNAHLLKKNFICILNDNNMSISKPVGNMSEYITRVRTSPLYGQAKKTFEQVVGSIPKVGNSLVRRFEKAVDHLRDLVINKNVGVMFEEFGFKYLGPIDGHDLETLMAALKFAKTYEGPIMVHIVTQKGKGHQPAEADPITYHGVAPKKKEGAPVAPKIKTFTETFGDTCIEICNSRKDVVVITPAMEGGSGLTPFKKAHPDRFYDVGIAEEHAVTFAGGLARGGIRPILAIYSSFLQRGFDQLVHDVCLQKLPVVFALDRAGIVGEDGPTHHGVLDFNFMLPIPHLAILAPKDGKELEDMLKWSINHKEAVSIRYPKGPIPDQNGTISTPIETMKSEVLCEFPDVNDQFDVLIIGVGSMAWPSAEAASTLKEQGRHTAVINLRFVKPLDLDTLLPYIHRSKRIVVVEEGNAIGGVFGYILESCIGLNRPLSDWHHIAIPDEFMDHGKMGTLRERYDLTTAGIIRRISG